MYKQNVILLKLNKAHIDMGFNLKMSQLNSSTHLSLKADPGSTVMLHFWIWYQLLYHKM